MHSAAPRPSQARHFSGEPAVAYTVAPNARASWMAVVPMPLLPPCTRMLSPAMSRPRSKTFVQTVKQVSGSAAACTSPSPAGTGRQSGAAARQYSAYPPPWTSAQIRSGAPAAPGPASTTSPAISSPGMSDAPGGGG